MRIRTSEEDTGLWSVWRGEQKIGYIWEPDKEGRWWANYKHEPYTPDQPQFVALEDWLHVKPGNPIEGCKTWHAALKAVCQWAKAKKKTYLTPAMVLNLKPGDMLNLGYDDFNVANFKYTHIRTFEDRGVRCVGKHEFEDSKESFDGLLYEFAGPHRNGEVMTPIMCSGSGAERIFIRS